VPVLVLAITEYLDKLLENGGTATIASLGKLGRIMVMTVHISVMLIVTILSAKDSRTKAAREVLDVIFSVKRSDI